MSRLRWSIRCFVQGVAVLRRRPPPLLPPEPRLLAVSSRSHLRAFALPPIVLCALVVSGCSGASTLGADPRELAEGTWGGADAGLLLDDARAHVHFGCTYGDFPAPIALDEDGRFSVSGEYLIRAFPVAVGPPLPAELAGVVRGRELTMTVAVNDTVEDRLVVFGPATVRFGEEPQMQMCPICETPD